MKKVIDIEDRIPSMRERRRKRANRKFIVVIAVFIIALLVFLYFQSSISKIDQIDVSGDRLYTKDFYIEKSQLAQGDTIWGFSKKKIIAELESMEGVKTAEVSRKWLRDVSIEIEEWQDIAYIETDEAYHLLLENGERFTTETMVPNENAPIISGFSNPKIEKDLVDALMSIENNVFQLISEVIYQGTEAEPEAITVYMIDGYEVRALISTFAEKIVYYPAMISQLDGVEKGVIDMEVGTYFTPYSNIYQFDQEQAVDESKMEHVDEDNNDEEVEAGEEENDD